LIVFITKHQYNGESVTCNKILPSPESSYSAPANLPISVPKIKKNLMNLGPYKK